MQRGKKPLNEGKLQMLHDVDYEALNGLETTYGGPMTVTT